MIPRDRRALSEPPAWPRRGARNYVVDRDGKRISQRTIADATGIPQSAVSKHVDALAGRDLMPPKG